MGKKRMIVEDVSYQTKGIGKVGPILPSFLHAACNANSLVKETKNVDVEVNWTGGDPDKAKPNIQVKLSTKNMTYAGEVSEASRDPYFTTFLAIRNKTTGKTRLIEANEVVLKPVVNHPKSTNEFLLREKKDEKDMTLAERAEARKNLARSFGRKQGINYYNQQEKMQIESSQVEDKMIKAAGVVEQDKIQETVKTEEVEIIPKRNNGAKTKEKVYLIEDMLTKVELKKLVEAGENILQEWRTVEDLKKAHDMKILSPLGVHLFTDFINSGDNIDNKVALALYAEGIIKFSKLRQGEMWQAENILQKYLPPTIKKKILSLFSENSGIKTGVVTPQLRDRAVCYIIILALTINNWRIDAGLITESVRVKPDQLKKLVSMTGAYMTTDQHTQSQVITFKLPLATFQVSSFTPKKKNRR